MTVLTNGNTTFQPCSGTSPRQSGRYTWNTRHQQRRHRKKLKELLERKAREGGDRAASLRCRRKLELGPKYVQDLRDAGRGGVSLPSRVAPVLRRRFTTETTGRSPFSTAGGLRRRSTSATPTWARIAASASGGTPICASRAREWPQLQTVFASDWLFCRKETIPEEELHPENPSSAVRPPSATFLQIVSSGPDTDWSAIFQGYFSLITSARKRLWITTPYFVPDGSILMALKTAALNGVDVRLLLPSKPDHFIVYWATRSNLDELLASGVRVFCYTGGFVHAKIVLADGVASVGTANMDIRSLEINFEVQSFIYDRAITARLEKDFLNDLGQSKELDLHRRRHRPLYERFLESTGRLFSSQLLRGTPAPGPPHARFPKGSLPLPSPLSLGTLSPAHRFRERKCSRPFLSPTPILHSRGTRHDLRIFFGRAFGFSCRSCRNFTAKRARSRPPIEQHLPREKPTRETSICKC